MVKVNRVTASVLAVISLMAVGVAMGAPSIASAGAIKHRTYSTSPTQKNDIDFLQRHSTLSQETISNLLSRGFVKEDIENIYMLRSFIEEKDYDKLAGTYRDVNKNVSLILEAKNVNKDEFDAALKRTFPADEKTSFDRVKSIKNLRYMPFD